MKNRILRYLLAAALATALIGCESSLIEGEIGEDGSENASSPGQPLMKATTLEPGTPVRVRTTNTLSTNSVQTGEAFAATLEEPIVDGTWVIATKGSTVRGVIANADAGGKVKGVASLSVRLTQIQTSDGQNVDIATNAYGVQAKSSKTKDAKKVGIASGAGAGAGAGGAAVVTTRGDAAVIGSESVITFELTEPVRIQKN